MGTTKHSYHTDYPILVVDDDPFTLQLVSTALRRHRAKVVTATNGFEALEILKTQPVVGVIVDIRMPKCDGIEMLRILRDTHIFVPPIIFMSAFYDETQMEELRGSYNLVYTKPFDLESLVVDALKLAAQYLGEEEKLA